MSERREESNSGGRPEYCQASKFGKYRSAASVEAYNQAAQRVFNSPCDLSVFRFLFNWRWHVAVIGAPPPADIDQELRQILAQGRRVSLPHQVVSLLWQRRSEFAWRGHWVEGHHHPGIRLPLRPPPTDE